MDAINQWLHDCLQSTYMVAKDSSWWEEIIKGLRNLNVECDWRLDEDDTLNLLGKAGYKLSGTVNPSRLDQTCEICFILSRDMSCCRFLIDIGLANFHCAYMQTLASKVKENYHLLKDDVTLQHMSMCLMVIQRLLVIVITSCKYNTSSTRRDSVSQSDKVAFKSTFTALSACHRLPFHTSTPFTDRLKAMISIILRITCDLIEHGTSEYGMTTEHVSNMDLNSLHDFIRTLNIDGSIHLGVLNTIPIILMKEIQEANTTELNSNLPIIFALAEMVPGSFHVNVLSSELLDIFGRMWSRTGLTSFIDILSQSNLGCAIQLARHVCVDEKTKEEIFQCKIIAQTEILLGVRQGVDEDISHLIEDLAFSADGVLSKTCPVSFLIWLLDRFQRLTEDRRRWELLRALLQFIADSSQDETYDSVHTKVITDKCLHLLNMSIEQPGITDALTDLLNASMTNNTNPRQMYNLIQAMKNEHISVQSWERLRYIADSMSKLVRHSSQTYSMQNYILICEDDASIQVSTRKPLLSMGFTIEVMFGLCSFFDHKNRRQLFRIQASEKESIEVSIEDNNSLVVIVSNGNQLMITRPIKLSSANIEYTMTLSYTFLRGFLGSNTGRLLVFIDNRNVLSANTKVAIDVENVRQFNFGGKTEWSFVVEKRALPDALHLEIHGSLVLPVTRVNEQGRKSRSPNDIFHHQSTSLHGYLIYAKGYDKALVNVDDFGKLKQSEKLFYFHTKSVDNDSRVARDMSCGNSRIQLSNCRTLKRQSVIQSLETIGGCSCLLPVMKLLVDFYNDTTMIDHRDTILECFVEQVQSFVGMLKFHKDIRVIENLMYELVHVLLSVPIGMMTEQIVITLLEFTDYENFTGIINGNFFIDQNYLLLSHLPPFLLELVLTHCAMRIQSGNRALPSTDVLKFYVAVRGIVTEKQLSDVQTHELLECLKATIHASATKESFDSHWLSFLVAIRNDDLDVVYLRHELLKIFVAWLSASNVETMIKLRNDSVDSLKVMFLWLSKPSHQQYCSTLIQIFQKMASNSVFNIVTAEELNSVILRCLELQLIDDTDEHISSIQGLMELLVMIIQENDYKGNVDTFSQMIARMNGIESGKKITVMIIMMEIMHKLCYGFSIISNSRIWLCSLIIFFSTSDNPGIQANDNDDGNLVEKQMQTLFMDILEMALTKMITNEPVGHKILSFALSVYVGSKQMSQVLNFLKLLLRHVSHFWEEWFTVITRIGTICENSGLDVSEFWCRLSRGYADFCTNNHTLPPELEDSDHYVLWVLLQKGFERKCRDCIQRWLTWLKSMKIADLNVRQCAFFMNVLETIKGDDSMENRRKSRFEDLDLINQAMQLYTMMLDKLSSLGVPVDWTICNQMKMIVLETTFEQWISSKNQLLEDFKQLKSVTFDEIPETRQLNNTEANTVEIIDQIKKEVIKKTDAVKQWQASLYAGKMDVLTSEVGCWSLMGPSKDPKTLRISEYEYASHFRCLLSKTHNTKHYLPWNEDTVLKPSMRSMSMIDRQPENIQNSLFDRLAIRSDSIKSTVSDIDEEEDEDLETESNQQSEIQQLFTQCNCSQIRFDQIMPAHLTIQGRLVSIHLPSAEAGHNTQSFSIDMILLMMPRRYRLHKNAVEIYLVDMRSYFLNFEAKVRDNLIKKIMRLRPKILIKWSTYNSYKAIRYSGLTEKWLEGLLTNFDYIMALNIVAGRSYNDISQYHVFPWVLKCYESPSYVESDPRMYRDLSKPIGIQNSDHVNEVLLKYQYLDAESVTSPSEWNPNQKYHYGSHYSNMPTIIHFLMRYEPFTELHVQLQGGRFDCPDRLFKSIPTMWHNIFTGGSRDVRELIPEMYYLPEVLLNLNGFAFGKQQHQDSHIDNVLLPEWAQDDAHKFVYLHRCALESDHVSRNLHQWIDLIFGYKQRGIEAVKAVNVFMGCCYLELGDEGLNQDNKAAIEVMISDFGQVPAQIFNSPHPGRSVEHGKLFNVYNCLIEDFGTTSSFQDIHTDRNSYSSVNFPSRSLIAYCRGIRARSVFIDQPSDRVALVNCSLENSIWTGTAFKVKYQISRSRTTFKINDMCDTALDSRNQNLMFTLNSQCTVLFTSGHIDNSVRMYSIIGLSPGRLQDSVRNGHSDTVHAISLDSTDRYLVTASLDCSIALWSLTTDDECKFSTRYPVQKLYGHLDPVVALEIVSELDLLISASSTQLIVHSIATGKIKFHQKPKSFEITHVTLSDYHYIVVVGTSTEKSSLSTPTLMLLTVNGLVYVEGKLSVTAAEHESTTIDAIFVSSCRQWPPLLITATTGQGYKEGPCQHRLDTWNLFTLDLLGDQIMPARVTSIYVPLSNSDMFVSLANGQMLVIDSSLKNRETPTRRKPLSFASAAKRIMRSTLFIKHLSELK